VRRRDTLPAWFAVATLVFLCWTLTRLHAQAERVADVLEDGSPPATVEVPGPARPSKVSLLPEGTRGIR